MRNRWNIQPKDIFAMGPVVPVLVLNNINDALPIAEALLNGGVKTIEITLRTPNALKIIDAIATQLPDILVGAGTVTNAQSLQQATDAGAKFLISPGLTPALLACANQGNIPLIPGISTISELMTGLEHHYQQFKFFPAEYCGGPAKLKAISGPFPDIKFCPTGGINPQNIGSYLNLPNVQCVGGSWLVSKDIIAEKNWEEISSRAKSVLNEFI